MPTIEIIVDPQGATKIQTKGYTGKACQAATRDLERALGVKTADKKTAEYYQTNTTTARQRAGN